MQVEHLGFWSFLILFEYCIRQETIFSNLIKLLFKDIWKNQVLNLYLSTLEAKHQQVQLQWTARKS